MHPLRSVVRARPARLAARAIPVAAGLVLAAGTTAYATSAVSTVSLTQVSHDIYTDAQAQHKTEVEPDVFAHGSTIVAAFQVGRVFGGGASNIGFATSHDGGATWTRGYLPGITGNGGGPFGQASDAAVAFDAKHNVWLISSLGIGNPGVVVLTSRSTDGGLTWSKPVTTAPGSNDKNWIVCDNTPSSPHYGNCYTEYDNTSAGDAMEMRTSTDGGATWGPALGPAGGANGLGGQPVVLPDGNVVVPFVNEAGAQSIRGFRSTDGGTSWGATFPVASIDSHNAAGGLRESPLPNATVDAAGTIYVAWSDCRFRSGCSSDDIVLAKSTSETTFGSPVRVPIDATTSTVEHFTPGLVVDPATSGATARIGLSYYYYPKVNCTAATCQLDAGFISSVNGGSTWSTAAQLAGPMSLSWLPNTFSGRMYGDYVATAIGAGGNAYPILPVAFAKTGTTFHLSMYVPTGGLAITGGPHPASAAHSHPFTPRHVRAPVPVTLR